ncbi:metabotropic glutamate receptor 3-like [Mya arenaria]|uniref:metabotropic glutamate receptor 3-like n=1 Tax=Mya arenaria TaxID=6604 RepID=UPI0022DF6894|nr:metabotropic glutamate receptor 3-like [Mya arenaria]
MAILWKILVAATCVSLFTRCLSQQTNNQKVDIRGDFLIGALFPIHNLHEGGTCGHVIQDQSGIQNLEALLFALNKVNTEILKGKNFKLGTLAYDTCYSDTEALRRAQQYVTFRTYTLGLESMFKCTDDSTPRLKTEGKLIGVVGAATSGVSIQLATFFRLFKIPQISYGATSTELSDTSRYDFFLRTVPSDRHQALAIVQILTRMEWTYVTVIYEDTSYGVMGYGEIEKYAQQNDICIAQAYKVKRFIDSEDINRAEIEDVVKSLLVHNNTEGKTVVILFASDDIVESVFSVTSDLNLKNRFRWVGSDAWTGRTVRSSQVAEGAIGVQPKIVKVPDFDKYFLGLRPDSHKQDPWFREYWDQVFNCSTQANETIDTGKKHTPHLARTCNPKLNLSEERGTYNRNLNTYAVMDAVYAFAYALKAWHEGVCGTIDNTICYELQEAKAEDLMTKGYLKNVSFDDPAGFRFKFHNSSGPARYSIMQYIHNKTTNTYKWEEVGDIDENRRRFKKNIRWLKDISSLYRPSVCSRPCVAGQATHTLPNRKCCWTCHTCPEYQYLNTYNQSCLDCPPGKQTNQSKTGCSDIPEDTIDMSHVVAIVAIIMSCLGAIITCLIAALFHWQRETPLIMASGKELSFVLLFGVLMSYLSTFAFVAYPTPVSCGTTRFMLGMSYTVCYAAILVKTNRIYRVFNIHTSKPKKVKYISAKSQLLITSAIVSVELAALVTWLISDRPAVIHEHPTRADNVRVCEDAKDFTYLGALVYPFLLMIVCIYYAFKTRKTPDGFNETRYITFGSYSFCVLWIAFISIYFSVTDNTIRIVALCFSSFINATVTLITLFITKVYVVLFRPQKNTRENVMSRRRTQSYETVSINNLSNLSRMASAVSTWHSVHPNTGSDNSSIMNGQPPQRFGTALSVSALSVNILNQSNNSLYSDRSTKSAPPVHRPFTEDEVTQFAARNSTDLGDERLQQFLENSIDSHSDIDEEADTGNGISTGVPRRSLRTFRSRRKQRRTVKRTRSMDAAHLPNIMVTCPSQEDNSKMVRVIHL